MRKTAVNASPLPFVYAWKMDLMNMTSVGEGAPEQSAMCIDKAQLRELCCFDKTQIQNPNHLVLCLKRGYRRIFQTPQKQAVTPQPESALW